MAIVNLPGIFENKLDGNLTIVSVNEAPIVLTLGQASQGVSETVFRVDRVSDASRVFGKTGTLVRGMFEASVAGALNLRLFRIGAKAAILAGIGDGSGDGITITTIRKDDSAGSDYEIFYDDAAGVDEGRLRIYRVSDATLIYDNNPSNPDNRVDLGEVSVTGSGSGAGAGGAHEGSRTIGSLTALQTLALAAHASAGGPSFLAGDDGLNLSRMELWEALHNAYSLLDSVDADVIVPMEVYLDDLNVMDMNEATVSGLDLVLLTDYPVKGANDDVLGKVFVQEYLGENLFWWWLPSSPNSDVDVTFTADSGANIFPVSGVGLDVGSASALTDAEGTALTGSDFHEVNFAYQLANFCYASSRDNTEMTGVIGVKGPNSFSLKDVSNWVGKLPSTEEDANGNIVISSGGNGLGLLGNKFMSGRL